MNDNLKKIIAGVQKATVQETKGDPEKIGVLIKAFQEQLKAALKEDEE